MKYEFEKVIEGISKYIDTEIYSGMNDLQEFAARVFIGRFLTNQESIKQSLINNGFLRTFNVIDESGMVDVETLATDIKREIARKDKITFSIPMFGKLTFKPGDVDVLVNTITGGGDVYEIN
jgi:hypothetical protein